MSSEQIIGLSMGETMEVVSKNSISFLVSYYQGLTYHTKLKLISKAFRITWNILIYSGILTVSLAFNIGIFATMTLLLRAKKWGNYFNISKLIYPFLNIKTSEINEDFDNIADKGFDDNILNIINENKKRKNEKVYSPSYKITEAAYLEDVTLIIEETLFAIFGNLTPDEKKKCLLEIIRGLKRNCIIQVSGNYMNDYIVRLFSNMNIKISPYLDNLYFSNIQEVDLVNKNDIGWKYAMKFIFNSIKKNEFTATIFALPEFLLDIVLQILNFKYSEFITLLKILFTTYAAGFNYEFYMNAADALLLHFINELSGKEDKMFQKLLSYDHTKMGKKVHDGCLKQVLQYIATYAISIYSSPSQKILSTFMIYNKYANPPKLIYEHHDQKLLTHVKHALMFDENLDTYILVIRGTDDVRDLLLDLCSIPIIQDINGKKCYFHEGMFIAAKKVLKHYDGTYSKNYFKKIMEDNKIIICTGHSLGAGVAAILVYLIQSMYNYERCYGICYATPACMDIETGQNQNIISIVNDTDMVPRLNIDNACRLSFKLSEFFYEQILFENIIFPSNMEKKCEKYIDLHRKCKQSRHKNCEEYLEKIKKIYSQDTYIQKYLQYLKKYDSNILVKYIEKLYEMYLVYIHDGIHFSLYNKMYNYFTVPNIKIILQKLAKGYNLYEMRNFVSDIINETLGEFLNDKTGPIIKKFKDGNLRNDDKGYNFIMKSLGIISENDIYLNKIVSGLMDAHKKVMDQFKDDQNFTMDMYKCQNHINKDMCQNVLDIYFHCAVTKSIPNDKKLVDQLLPGPIISLLQSALNTKYSDLIVTDKNYQNILYISILSIHFYDSNFLNLYITLLNECFKDNPNAISLLSRLEKKTSLDQSGSELISKIILSISAKKIDILNKIFITFNEPLVNYKIFDYIFDTEFKVMLQHLANIAVSNKNFDDFNNIISKDNQLTNIGNNVLFLEYLENNLHMFQKNFISTKETLSKNILSNFDKTKMNLYCPGSIYLLNINRSASKSKRNLFSTKNIFKTQYETILTSVPTKAIDKIILDKKMLNNHSMEHYLNLVLQSAAPECLNFDISQSFNKIFKKRITLASNNVIAINKKIFPNINLGNDPEYNMLVFEYKKVLDMMLKLFSPKIRILIYSSFEKWISYQTGISKIKQDEEYIKKNILENEKSKNSLIFLKKLCRQVPIMENDVYNLIQSSINEQNYNIENIFSIYKEWWLNNRSTFIIKYFSYRLPQYHLVTNINENSTKMIDNKNIRNFMIENIIEDKIVNILFLFSGLNFYKFDIEKLHGNISLFHNIREFLCDDLFNTDKSDSYDLIINSDMNYYLDLFNYIYDITPDNIYEHTNYLILCKNDEDKCQKNNTYQIAGDVITHFIKFNNTRSKIYYNIITPNTELYYQTLTSHAKNVELHQGQLQIYVNANDFLQDERYIYITSNIRDIFMVNESKIYQLFEIPSYTQKNWIIEYLNDHQVKYSKSSLIDIKDFRLLVLYRILIVCGKYIVPLKNINIFTEIISHIGDIISKQDIKYSGQKYCCSDLVYKKITQHLLPYQKQPFSIISDNSLYRGEILTISNLYNVAKDYVKMLFNQ